MTNFRQIVLDVQNYINDTSTATEAIIKDEVNCSIKEVLNSGLWRFAIRQTTFNTTATLEDYYLPLDVDKIISITQHGTPTQLGRIWVGDFDRLVPDTSQGVQGAPKYYMELFEDNVWAQPTAAGKVTVRSTNNQDITGLTGANKATIFGVAGGRDIREVLTLSATNYVSSSASFTKLYSITTNISCVGTVQFGQAVVGTDLLELYNGETRKTFKKIKVYPVPDNTYTMYLTYQAGYLDLVNDSDVPIIPDRYVSVLIDMTIGRLMARQGDAKASYYEQKAAGGLADMKKSEDTLWDYTPRVRPPECGYIYDQGYPF